MAESPTSNANGSTASPPTWGDGLAPFAKLSSALQAQAMRDSIELTRRNTERTLETVHGLPRAEERPEDMIAVDSPTTVVHHNYPPAAAAPAVANVAAAAPLKPIATMSTLAKIALAFAVSGPVGAGIAALPWVAKWAAGSVAPAAVAPAATPATGDTTSPEPAARPAVVPVFKYELRLGK